VGDNFPYAPATKESPFIDPTGQMGRQNIMQWDPGDNIFQSKLNRMMAFNQSNIDRTKFAYGWRLNEILLRLKNGIISPQEAGQLMELADMGLERSGLSEEEVNKIYDETLTAAQLGFETLPPHLQYMNEFGAIPMGDDIRWNEMEDPWANPRRKELYNQGMEELARFKNDSMYQMANEPLEGRIGF